MGAVKQQPGLSMPDRLSSRYGGVPVIYVESDDDSYVFGECWFKERLSSVEFRPASTQCGVSGCNAVVKAVGEERRAGNPAWGIVDRDTVLSQDMWALVHETDDAAFESAKPFGPEIKTLRRWEMESYLADGEVLEKCRAEMKLQPARPSLVVHNELLEHCQVLVPHAAVNALLHTYKVSGLRDGYVTKFSTRAEIDADIRSKHLPRLSHTATNVVEEYGQQVSKVDAFDVPNLPPEHRVNALLRRVHGKALLLRFASSHGIHDDMKGLLANRIKEMNLVPEELTTFVDGVVLSN